MVRPFLFKNAQIEFRIQEHFERTSSYTLHWLLVLCWFSNLYTFRGRQFYNISTIFKLGKYGVYQNVCRIVNGTLNKKKSFQVEENRFIVRVYIFLHYVPSFSATRRFIIGHSTSLLPPLSMLSKQYSLLQGSWK